MLMAVMAKLHASVYAARLRELVRVITPMLMAGDRVLDVGCGTGALGRAILEGEGCPAGVEFVGAERVRRGNEVIEVVEYDGRTLPYADESFDVVLLADVLHHEAEPGRLLDECARVARRLLVVKDHKVDGPLAWHRIALLDWAANAPYGVPCLYRYNTPAQWRDLHRRHGLAVEHELQSMRLYPPMYNWFFGNRLQYLAVLRPGGPVERPVSARAGAACGRTEHARGVAYE